MTRDNASDIAYIRSNLTTLKAWIEHWEEDRRAGLPCTEESLANAKFLVTDSLSRIDAKRPSPGVIVATHNPYDEATMLRQVPPIKREGEAA